MSGGAGATIQVACPKCGKHLKAPAAAAGKKARCPSCQSLMMMPSLPQAHLPQSPFPQSQYPPPVPGPGYPSAPLPDLPVLGAAVGATQQPGAGSALSGGLSDLLDEDQPSGWGAGDGYAVAAPEPSAASTGAIDTRYQALAPVKPRKKRKSTSTADMGTALGGLGMMILAVVWFVLALVYLDRFFIYPPIMFVMGLVAFLKGLFSTLTGGD